MEPLGQSQVLRYQEGLARVYKIVLISFEKSDEWQNVERRNALSNSMHEKGIIWIPLRYHKRPSALATGYDIVQGVIVGIWAVLSHRVGIVHARSYVPSVIALVLKKLFRTRFIFDMRGFWADERVDGGLWQRDSYIFRVAKGFERRFLLEADHVVSLTHAAVTVMQHFDYLQGRSPAFTVIPTCADLARFRPMPGIRQGDFVLGYVGSVGTWYDFDATVACFAELLRMKPEARFLIINRNEHAYILERLVAAAVPLASVELRTASHEEVPAQMARMHAGIFFIKPVFSKQASAPTKLGEFLGCGIPCLSNGGVGDMAEILESEQVGIAVEDFSVNALRSGLMRLLELVERVGIEQLCVAAAQKHFSLEEGVRAYANVYRELLTQPV